MRITLPLLLAATLTVTGCATISDSRVNPLNWFSPSQPSMVTSSGERRPLTPAGGKTRIVDSRGAIQSITDLTLERTSEGAIVRASGLASTLGQFNAELVETAQQNGVLTLTFRIESAGNAAIGSAYSRQVTAAYALSSNDLQEIRTIQVQSATNARSVSR
ncbi:hypothetical protein [Yoonia sp. MH D7]